MQFVGIFTIAQLIFVHLIFVFKLSCQNYVYRINSVLKYFMISHAAYIYINYYVRKFFPFPFVFLLTNSTESTHNIEKMVSWTV